jgi:tRNA threonylcarbamoyladenosine biosynthesis protein TsaB
MLLLALDTSTRQASIALCGEEALYGEYTWDVGNNHSVELLLHIQRLVEACKKAMQDIDGLAVATGPGSFNGTRVAVASAKALAFALRKPLVGVSTLDIIAAQQRWNGPICAILEAGRAELYAASYLQEQAYTESGDVSFQLRRLSDYLLLPPPQLCSFLQDHAGDWVGVPGERVLPPILFCGEMTMDSRQALRVHLPEMSMFLGPVQATRHASTLAMLAFQRLREGRADDPLSLEPLYIRRPSITTSTRKQPLLPGA